MWEDYADNHKGFIVGFNSSIIFPHYFCGGGKVIYFVSLPILYPEPINNIDEHLFIRIFGKLTTYSFEEEYRVYIFNHKAMTQNERILMLPPEAFTKIIIGEDMPQNERDDLFNSLPIELKHMEIEYAQKKTMK
jgi:hypothetical protein